MNYSDLKSFYENEWAMKYYHHYSLEEQNNMIPFERDIHIAKTVAHLKKMKDIQES